VIASCMFVFRGSLKQWKKDCHQQPLGGNITSIWIACTLWILNFWLAEKLDKQHGQLQKLFTIIKKTFYRVAKKSMLLCNKTQNRSPDWVTSWRKVPRALLYFLYIFPKNSHLGHSDAHWGIKVKKSSPVKKI